ncbi:glycosyltransferase [Arenibacterium halophilum]|uniref:Colanic acid biosynthesis glycosyltransferase WcaL n=1 Tax=Arenibacterium halophilum TaxID=2583821 RepID=A0ABY2X6J1_9RHOB|nr:glycosyltransferase [Arenibacterium halophilum]TMV11404.1 colanic acid biosynthesis glycosyltransferase WcaL [Arenibacterium halophilum]
MSDTPANGPALAVVVKGWPRLSETFIAQELAGLQDMGHDFAIWSLRHPTDTKTHPLHDKITAPVHYLPEYLRSETARVLAAYRAARRLPGFAEARRIWRADFARDRTRNRVRRFGQACVLATELPAGTRAIYSHFLHTPSTVARYAAVMLGIPWAFSAHAKDIWTSPDWELREKMAGDATGATFGATCTAFGADTLRDLATDPDRIDLIYHGLDLSRFPAPPERPKRAPGDPIHLVSVGRLVEKKGFDRLIAALSMLPDTLDWRWTHIGGGELKDQMRDMAAKGEITDRITWRGPLTQPEVIEAMRASDLFVLPSRIAINGDRDGLPNVLMEAASQKLPILSTAISAIPEFIESGTQGLLASDRPQDLADAIAWMAENPDDARAMADAALDRLRSDFGAEPGLRRLSERLTALTGA